MSRSIERGDKEERWQERRRRGRGRKKSKETRKEKGESLRPVRHTLTHHLFSLFPFLLSNFAWALPHHPKPTKKKSKKNRQSTTHSPTPEPNPGLGFPFHHDRCFTTTLGLFPFIHPDQCFTTIPGLGLFPFSHACPRCVR